MYLVPSRDFGVKYFKPLPVPYTGDLVPFPKMQPLCEKQPYQDWDI